MSEDLWNEAAVRAAIAPYKADLVNTNNQAVAWYGDLQRALRQAEKAEAEVAKLRELLAEARECLDDLDGRELRFDQYEQIRESLLARIDAALKGDK
jgi:nicotinamide riboside kinase